MWWPGGCGSRDEMTQVLAPWEIELAQAFRVSFEDDHRTTILKQFLFQNLKADIDVCQNSSLTLMNSCC